MRLKRAKLYTGKKCIGGNCYKQIVSSDQRDDIDEDEQEEWEQEEEKEDEQEVEDEKFSWNNDIIFEGMKQRCLTRIVIC